MKQFEANSLEEAYKLASDKFKCSITKLKVDIIQHPSRGFLFFGKKKAIISCELLYSKTYKEKIKKDTFKKSSIKIEELSKRIASCERKDSCDIKRDNDKVKNDLKVESKAKEFDSFYNENDIVKNSKIVLKKDKDTIKKEIKEHINDLFCDTCFILDEIDVEFYDEKTIYIEFCGEDSGLLIGKEGYRYNALSYILFNWINEKYNLNLRLEVAQFLKNQEISIDFYLESVIEKIKDRGSYKTKPFDGILVDIVLRKLRSSFPNKYVGVKTNQKGDKYILVNEYKNKKNSN